MKNRIYTIMLAMILVAFAIVPVLFTSENIKIYDDTCKIERWIDGDTFVCDDGIHVRLWNVYAPECKKKRNKGGGMSCIDDKYHKYMNSKYDDKDVELKYKGVSYNRIVADVRIGSVNLSKDLQNFINTNKKIK